MIKNPIGEIAKANIQEIYKDSLQPSVRVLGKSLAQCTSLFATPIGRTAEILEKNLNKYLDKLEGFTEEDLIPPDTRIIVPILEKLRYIEDEKVTDYYTEILAAASQKNHRNRIALSYIEILNRLTSDELKILEYIASKNNVIDISKLNNNEEELKKFGYCQGINNINITNTLPIINVKIITNNTSGYKEIIKNFNPLDSLNLDFKDINHYLDNLVSLGLLIKSHGTCIEPRNLVYTHLKNHSKISEIKLPENQRIDFEIGKLDLSDLCKNLLDLCNKKK